MATAEQEQPELPGQSKEDRDWEWKRDQLVRWGVPVEDAVLLADLPDGLGRARNLIVNKGCPPQLAARIVL